MVTQPIAATHNEAKNKDGDIPVAIVFLAPICFMAVCAIYLSIISSFLKSAENKNSLLNIEHLNQCPCKKCKFFHENNYLKCAVSPSIVLTKQAINCSEYQPR
ncbi:hypothetical protein GNE08_27470 (plasmid) [Trichormus variabilis ARAD]|nr:hypothetical protein [Trichormus variabilis ARAD]